MDIASLPKHSVAVVAAVVDDDGRVLVIRRRDNGHWQPPGGVLELDESIEAGLAREVHEETGVRVEPLVLTGAYKNMRRGIVALVFRCRVLGGEPRTTAEAQEVRWLRPEDVASHMDEAHAVRIADALDPGAPRVRAHDGTRLLAGA